MNSMFKKIFQNNSNFADHMPIPEINNGIGMNPEVLKMLMAKFGDMGINPGRSNIPDYANPNRPPINHPPMRPNNPGRTPISMPGGIGNRQPGIGMSNPPTNPDGIYKPAGNQFGFGGPTRLPNRIKGFGLGG